MLKKIIILTIIIAMLSIFCSGCSLNQMLVYLITFITTEGKMLTFGFPSNSDQLKPSEEPMSTGRDITWVLRDENGNEIDSSTSGLVPEPNEQSLSQKLKISEDAAIKIDTAMMFMGQNKDTTPSQIVQSASEPPEDQIPVVAMPQDTPDIPEQDDRTIIADADQQPEDSPDHHDDKSPIPTKPDIQPADEPEDTTATTEEQPSYGEQEQPHHEHDIFTYYDPELYPGENTQTITISVNIKTGEVSGHFDFAGYIGDSGYRTASYNFATYLDSSSSFNVKAEGIIYEDGQYFDKTYYIITGTLSSDKSHIEGEIVDELYTDMSAPYYAELISQTEEQPEKENY